MMSDDGWDGFERTIELLQRRTHERCAGIVGTWGGQAGLISTRRLASIADVAADDSYLDFVAWKYRDVQQYNCWHEDRSAAGSGVEARVPFLDRSLVELSVGVPRELRRELLWDKEILRRGMRGRLADDLVDREKIAFFYGSGVKHTYRSFGRMLLADSGRLIEQALETTGARAFLDADAVRATAKASALRGEPGQLELVLRLVNLGLLESQLQALPGHHTAAAHASAPASFVPAGADAERTATEALCIPAITATTIGALEDSVEILHDASAHFVVVDGQVEFVVEPDENPAWTRVLLGFDGVTPLGEFCDPTDLADVAATFEMAADAGVVRIVEPVV